MHNKINIVFGTTASGKTDYAVELAKKLDGEILNCDSMQVYKELPILTAQPTLQEKKGIPHKFYGHISCLNQYSVAEWLKDVVPEINKILLLGKTPILVGGTGMYIKSLVAGISNMPSISQKKKEIIRKKYTDIPSHILHKKLAEIDITLYERYKKNDRQRILHALAIFEITGISLSQWQKNRPTPYFSGDRFHFIFLERPREEIYNRINARFDKMIALGVIEEVRRLYNTANRAILPRAHGLGEIIDFLNGNITLNEAILRAKQVTRNYAKRQLTWARHQFNFISNKD